nr:radical SAM family heme chaperone HemW [Ruminococcus sp.]
MSAAGIYIHVPFCLRKCPYCDFYSVKFDADTAHKYVDAVCRNIAAFGDRNVTADTVYFGGGTPSLLTPAQVEHTLDTVYKNISLHSPEITLEANPSSLTPEKLRGYRAAGVNRLSVGFQSADDGQLRFLGRLHDTARAENAVLDAHAAGFDNISCDLILGSEGQDIGSLDRTIDRLLALPISHISAYMLKIEPGTPFDCDDIRRRSADEETLCQLYERMCERLSAAGYEHYEISNFARDGRRSRHNMKYWRVEPYIGIGASAHSDFGRVRYFCPPDVSAFIAAETQPVEIED